MHYLAGVVALVGPGRLVLGTDAAVFKLINGACSCSALDFVMVAATCLGIGSAQVGVCLCLVMAGLLAERMSWRRAGYAGLVAFVVGGVAVACAKLVWDRPRPLLTLVDVNLIGDPLFTRSFPSGHTTTAFALAVAISAYLPRWRVLFIALATLTGISRVYLGVHFPLDVLCGAILGTAAGCLSARLVRPRQEHRLGEEEQAAEKLLVGV